LLATAVPYRPGEPPSPQSTGPPVALWREPRL
jgi:hypothetical protein